MQFFCNYLKTLAPFAPILSWFEVICDVGSGTCDLGPNLSVFKASGNFASNHATLDHLPSRL